MDVAHPNDGALRRRWRALERFAESRRAAPALLVAALVVYGLVSLALPVSPGRDLGRYLVVYAQLFGDVVYPYALVSRPPGTPLVAGAMLDLGPIAAEAGAAALYALSILAWCSVARRFGPAAAIATAVALLAYPGYVLLFHKLSSDAVFAAAFALTAPLLARALERPSAGRTAALGAGVAACILTRPVAQVLLLLALVPLVVAPTWRGRLQGAAAFALAAILPLLAWAGHNAVRGDDFTLGARRRRDAAALPRLRRRQDRRAGERRRVAGARGRGRARPAPGGAVPLVRDLARRVLLVRQRAHARGPDRPRRPHVGLGRRLRPPRAGRPRGGARASGDVRARGRAAT